jgi:hypothetical protein
MKKVCSLSLTLIVSFGILCSQSKNAISPDYDRNSLTLILLDHPEIPNSSLLKDGIVKVRIPDKFFDNPVDIRYLNAPYSANYIGAVSNSVKNIINKEKIGNKIISYWYARQPDGTMSADRFLERGAYNATDGDVLKAKGTKRGVEAIRDYGDRLIGRSYAVAIDYTKFTAIDNENLRGWSSDVRIYLYKISFSPDIQAKLYNDLWIYQEDTPELKVQKKAAFDQMNFEMEYVSQAGASVTETESKKNTSKTFVPKTNEELLAILMQKGFDESLYNLEKHIEDLRVKTALYEINPPRAKIGKKEGLAVDHRYFVYEYVYNEKLNNSEPVMRSVIRAKKVIDNRNVATGSSGMSTFYQVAGGHLEKGFTLQQRNDAGIGVQVGDELGIVGGISARVEVNTGRFVSVPSLYVFIGGGMQTKTYTGVHDKNNVLLSSQDIQFLRYELGLAKGIRIVKIMELAPYGSVGYEEGRNKDWKDDVQFNGNVVKAMYIKFGANLAVNLHYNFQLVGGLGSYQFLNAEDGKAALKIGDEKVKYNYYFKDRGGNSSISTYLGLRIQF